LVAFFFQKAADLLDQDRRLVRFVEQPEQVRQPVLQQVIAKELGAVAKGLVGIEFLVFGPRRSAQDDGGALRQRGHLRPG
jgi:hypothetical protein